MTRPAALAVLALLTWACSASGAPEGDPLAVQWSGCDAVVAGGCAIEGSRTPTLVAWVDDADPALRIVDDRGGVHGPDALLDGGRRFRLSIAPDVSTLRMLDVDGRSRWTLPIVRREPTPRDDGAPTTIDEVEALPGPRRAQALRDGFSAAHAAGDAKMAQEFAVASHVVALTNGEWSTACGVAQGAAFSAQHLGGDSARALAWLDLTRWCDARVPESAADAAYYRGVVRVGDGRRIEALEQLHVAWRGASRLGRDAEAHAYAVYYATVLGEAGFTVAAERQFERLASSTAPGCPSAMLALNQGWLLQLRGEAEGSAPLLRRAESVLEQGLAGLDDACADALPLLAETFRLDLAHGALLLGDPTRAQAELAGIDPSRLDPERARWFHRLDAAVALALSRPERAAAWLAAVAQSSDDGDDHDAIWRDRALAARLADALGDPESARDHDLAAERALDGMVASFAQGIAAGPLLGSHPESSARLVARALAAGDRVTAWCTMRWARRRPLLATAAATWRMHDPAVAARLGEHRDRLAELARAVPGADRESQRIRGERRTALVRAFAVELANGLPGTTPRADANASGDCGPSAPAGTLVLAFHPATGGGWTVFAALDGAIETTWIAGAPTDYDAQALSDRVLGPFSALVERAARIRVLPAGPWNTVDLHALPWGPNALVVARPVTYALDIEVPAAPAGAGVTVSFVDADPLRDLAEFRGPMLAVQRRLAAVRPTVWSEPSGVDELLGAVVGVDAWIDFGHAAPPRAGDDVPWQSSIGLLLPGEQRLDAFDLLSAPGGAPRQVALLGCGTGTVDPSLPPGSITLPQALVIRGARTVVATGDDVAPALAVTIAERLADSAPAGADTIDLRAALRAAQLELRERDPTAAWATFRVWEP